MIQQGEDLRFERKAYIDHIDRHSLISLVLTHPALFKKVHNERIVNSLYFDTSNFSDAKEKIDGLKSRRKARIRWYGTLFGEIQKPILEIKSKENGLGWKMRYPLHPFVIEPRRSPPIRLEYVDTAGTLLPKTMTMIRNPSSLISYRRLYFLSNDRRFRLTVDDQLRSYCPLKNSRGWTHNPENPPGIIIELKYSKEDDDDARQITSWYPFRWGAFSKYIHGLESAVRLF
jgi:hypothetical protein